jgi:hypothetical protein
MKRMRLQDDVKEPQVKTGPHRFKKGHEKLGGRSAGTRNRVTTELKVAIMTAAAMVGSDNRGKDGVEGYLAWLARKEPDVFGRLLGKLLPYQLTGKDGGPVQFEAKTKEEVVQRFKERGLPLPVSLIDVEPASQARN